MKNINEFLVGCVNGINNEGWLSGAAVVYKIKLENEVLYVKSIDKNKKIINSNEIPIKEIKYAGKESDDVYYIKTNIKRISMHAVEQNESNVKELMSLLKDYGIEDNNESTKLKKRVLIGIYSFVIIVLGLIMFL